MRVPGTPKRIKIWVEVLTGQELDDRGALRVLDADIWHKPQLNTAVSR